MDNNQPLSARSNGAPSPGYRAKSNWQRASFSATKRPNSGSRGNTTRRSMSQPAVSHKQQEASNTSDTETSDKQEP